MLRPIPLQRPPFRLLAAYTGCFSIDDALGDERAVRLLWLEILVNDALDLTPWRDRAEVREAYTKACRWYTTYRTLIDGLIARTPLPPGPGPTDPKDYRVFAEALRFVADYH